MTKPALMFGLVYAVVLLGVAAAHEYFGQQGLYLAAALSGLTDMDAITLSVANLVNGQEIAPGTGWRVILVAAMANLAAKAAVSLTVIVRVAAPPAPEKSVPKLS
jgi:uncharacterized membrane protein (DUF4010 family)